MVIVKNKRNSSDEIVNEKVSIWQKLKSNKLIITLFCILIVVAIISLIVNLSNKSKPNDNNPTTDEVDDININTKEDITKEQKQDGISFQNTTLFSQNGESYLSVDITNNNSTDYTLNEIHIFLKNSQGQNVINYKNANGEDINYLVGYVGDTIAPNETVTITTTIDNAISEDSYSISYEIVK